MNSGFAEKQFGLYVFGSRCLQHNLSESRMREIRTSGLMSGNGNGAAPKRAATAPFLDSNDG